ncbi:MAG: 16S rRNA (adenine(1518)-N(6)/adenine(1519)-N(6))-dimethyltransferase RsmA [Patescibacteria group bacterium]
MQLREFHPKKSFGQNFLIQPMIVEKILQYADLPAGALVVEVGPGFGILTSALLARNVKVKAIEKDNHLFAHLQAEFGMQKNLAAAACRDTHRNLELIHADALDVPPPQVPYYWVANIPYSITSPLLDHFIRKSNNLPQRAVLLVQKEVAEKICASPPHMNVLALHVQTFGVPKIMKIVSRRNFKPVPKVDSAILKIEFPAATHDQATTSVAQKTYFENIHRGFSHKRKMLRGVFDVELLKKAGIELTRRAETLSIEEWEKLAHFSSL